MAKKKKFDALDDAFSETPQREDYGSEDDLPIDPKPAKKVSVEAGAPSEGKHHHRKFDKFKKGN